MSSTDVTIGLPTHDAGNLSSAALFAKLAKSPSRRHKPIHSRGSSGSLDANIPNLISVTSPSRTRPRPGFQRIITAPAAPQSLAADKVDNDVVATVYATSTSGPPSAIPHTLVSNSLSPPPYTSLGTAGLVPTVSVNGMIPSAQYNQMGGQSQNPSNLCQQIHELSRKRIATLDYLRKAHEGTSFWFTSVQFLRSDIARLPSYAAAKLARRATNYLLLGMSIPAVLDIHTPPHSQSSTSVLSNLVMEYLRSLNNLLTEFESFQQLHPADGSTSSSLSRARIPNMFKRATTNRPRKSSGTPLAEIGLPMQNAVSPPALPDIGHQHHSSQPSIDTTFTSSTSLSSAPTLINSPPSASLPGFPPASAFPSPGSSDAPNSILHPNEGPYTYLLTPPLPFSPDFYSVFATLCDVLIDTYQRLLQFTVNPTTCTPSVSDMFMKTDAKLRKVIVGGIIRDFETASREVARRELMGVQKVVLGGLMGT